MLVEGTKEGSEEEAASAAPEQTEAESILEFDPFAEAVSEDVESTETTAPEIEVTSNIEEPDNNTEVKEESIIEMFDHEKKSTNRAKQNGKPNEIYKDRSTGRDSRVWKAGNRS